jgi:hypothetical protein
MRALYAGTLMPRLTPLITNIRTTMNGLLVRYKVAPTPIVRKHETTIGARRPVASEIFPAGMDTRLVAIAVVAFTNPMAVPEKPRMLR